MSQIFSSIALENRVGVSKKKNDNFMCLMHYWLMNGQDPLRLLQEDYSKPLGT